MTLGTTHERLTRLDERIAGYHGQTMADVLELLDYLREDGDTVIAGGSLSIDQGNGESDLDMVVVGPANRTSAVPFEHWVGTLRVDAWSRATADVDALFAQAEAALASDAPLAGAFGNAVQEQQLKLLHRIAFGVVVEGEPVRPTARGSALDLASALLARDYAERARESALVTQLALAAGRDLTAATVGRVAVEEALHAVIHGRGLPFSGDKWLAEQLVPMPELAALHEEVAIVPRAADALAAVGARAVEIVGELLGLDTAPAALGAGLSWNPGDLALLPLGGRQVLVAREHGGGWELDPEEAEAWTTLVAAAGPDDPSRLPHPADGGAGDALCVKLHELGLLQPAWERGLSAGPWSDPSRTADAAVTP